jgi:hypothetical protein
MTSMPFADEVFHWNQALTSQRPSLAFYRCADRFPASDHDVEAKARVAESLAALMGCDYIGDFVGGQPRRPTYFVPDQTLSLSSAQRLGIEGPQDLFGGVVPHPFVGTKLISHGLVATDALAPPGWSAELGGRLTTAVLPGFSVFTAADAQRAALSLWPQGSVRIKDPAGVGGSGQWVVHNEQALEQELARLDGNRLAERGLVIERNLQSVVTHSVGQVQVGDMVASYYGTQRLTRNHRGHEVYGGSDLTVFRCDLAELLRQPLALEVRIAVEQALTYHLAVMSSFPELIASRANYDVAQGVSDDGCWHSGVLEQSWRIGGASGAEAAALHAFKANPGLHSVRASTCEVYGDTVDIPERAWVLFDGVDGEVGAIVKYVELTLPHGHA